MSSPSAYDYELPRHLIAQHPLARRSDARLLVVDRAAGTLGHFHVRDLPSLLTRGDALVVNDTRVIPARLVGFRSATGGRWEGLFLSADAAGNWRLLGKTRGKLAAGEQIALVNERLQEQFELRLLVKEESGSWIARPLAEGDPLALFERVGRVPLPPYIRDGEMVPADRQRYQTVFADVPGAVAAPTAGLHFTNELLAELERAGVARHASRCTSAPTPSDPWPATRSTNTRCTASGARSGPKPWRPSSAGRRRAHDRGGDDERPRAGIGRGRRAAGAFSGPTRCSFARRFAFGPLTRC